MKWFSAPKTSSIPLKNPERVMEGRGGRRCRRIARSKGRWWEGKGRRYKMGRYGDKRFGDKGGAKVLH